MKVVSRFKQGLLFALLTFGFALAAGRAYAKNLYSYDLDSLVYMSTDIVEGTLAEPIKEGWDSATRFHITNVWKGKQLAGTSIPVCGLDIYRTNTDVSPPLHSQPLLKGAHIVLFLSRTIQDGEWHAAFEPPAGYLMTVASGVKLVSSDNSILKFVQHSNPGPYADEPENIPGSDRRLSLDRLREKVRIAIPKTDTLAAHFQAEPTPGDTKWLLAFLKEYHQSFPAGTFTGLKRHHVAELACQRLANLHVFSALDEALPLAAPGQQTGMLLQGYGFPEGRKHLLAQVADRRIPEATRLLLCWGFGATGPSFGETCTEISPYSCRFTQHSVPENASYLKRIVEMATRFKKDAALRDTLLNSFDNFSESLHRHAEIDNDTFPEVWVDYRNAMTLLRTLHDDPALQNESKLRFQIEAWTLRGASDLAETFYPGSKGAILSFAEPESRPYIMRKAGSLTFRYRYASFLPHGEWAKPRLVLEDASHHRFIVPLNYPGDIDIHSRGENSCINQIDLPADIAHGSCQVHLEFVSSSGRVSTGYGYTALL